MIQDKRGGGGTAQTSFVFDQRRHLLTSRHIRKRYPYTKTPLSGLRFFGEAYPGR